MSSPEQSMSSPEQSSPSELIRLLAAEQERMRDPNVVDPPADAKAMELDKYRNEVKALKLETSADQKAAFLKDFSENELSSLIKLRAAYPKTEFKIMPVVVLSARNAEAHGYLDYYVMNERNVRLSVDQTAFLDAVIPAELIANTAKIPLEMNAIEDTAKMADDLEERVDELLKLVQ